MNMSGAIIAATATVRAIDNGVKCFIANGITAEFDRTIEGRGRQIDCTPEFQHNGE